MKDVVKLPDQILGEESTKGIFYQKTEENQFGYIYEAKDLDCPKVKYFEVFQKMNINNKEIYPRDESFGFWAWTYPTLEQAKKRLLKFN